MSEGKLVILAGGISSRMKKPAELKENVDSRLIEDSNLKTKSMIGVGNNYRPFLDYLLYNAREAGYKDILIVIGQNDHSIKQYYGEKDSGNEFYGLNISYAVQKIAQGKVKPDGTADALWQGLLVKKDWTGQRFTVCNSDNLYSKLALELMLKTDYPNAMINYDRSGLEFDVERIERFAVTLKDKNNFLTDIIEKPTGAEIEKVRDSDGVIGVSMNIFSLQYDMIFPVLETVPFHPVRNEKELPEAVKIMANSIKDSVFAYTLLEHVPDLTAKSDIFMVKKYLQEHFPNFKL
ncbi:MAG: sugar phosphate nucleotidyltransferase [Ignavibacteriaceae bacterium]|nr:sugar phosphate nucleotidyltransferase [Ignavibacteriaceae bacterium]